MKHFINFLTQGTPRNLSIRGTASSQPLKQLLHVLCLLFSILPLFLDTPKVIAASPVPTPTLITIPLSALDVEQATATVSVLQEPRSPIHTLLTACQSNLLDELIVEEKDVSEEVRKLCQRAERFTRRHLEPPSHNLNAKGYVITVPLKTTHQGIEALVWNTPTLDEAITFVNLLQSGKLKALKAYTSVPWGSTSPEPCTECPIKELVFHAVGIKDQLELLRGSSKTGEPQKD